MLLVKKQQVMQARESIERQEAAHVLLAIRPLHEVVDLREHRGPVWGVCKGLPGVEKHQHQELVFGLVFELDMQLLHSDFEFPLPNTHLMLPCEFLQILFVPRILPFHDRAPMA